MDQAVESRLEVNGTQLAVHRIGQVGTGRPCLVFLHEGLGCIAMWRDFPQQLARALALPALVYSRAGYGRSERWRAAPEPDFMHRAARDELPALLAAAGIDQPILVGHSDGASIALIAAAESIPARALVTLAPHLFVEDKAINAIAQTRSSWHATDLRQRLGRFHDHADELFSGWSDIWLSPAFAQWNIEAETARIQCPILAIQGRDDEYGTLAQIHRLAACAPDTLLLELPGIRHSPHLDASERCINAICGFLRCRVPAP